MRHSPVFQTDDVQDVPWKGSGQLPAPECTCVDPQTAYAHKGDPNDCVLCGKKIRGLRWQAVKYKMREARRRAKEGQDADKI